MIHAAYTQAKDNILSQTSERELGILMVDLSGYTAMTDVHGGEVAARLVGRFIQLTSAAISGKAELLQQVGDQVVLISDDPEDLMETARNMLALASEEQYFLGMHAGLHYGRVLMQGKNLFGSTITIASRLMSLAGRSEVIASAEFLEKVPRRKHADFVRLGSRQLRNVLHDVNVFRLIVKNKRPIMGIDPVCNMFVHPLHAEVLLQEGSKKHYFCSVQCLQAYQEAPHRFNDYMDEML